MKPLTPEQSDMVAREMAHPGMASLRAAMRKRFETVLGEHRFESLWHWALVRAAGSHQSHRQLFRSSVRRFFSFEVKRELRSRFADRNNTAESLTHRHDTAAAAPGGRDEEEPSASTARMLGSVLGWMSRYLNRTTEQVVRLRYLHGLSYAEISREAGVDEKAAKRMAGEGIAKLRRLAGVPAGTEEES